MKKLFLQKQPDDIIQSAVQRARRANHELNKIQGLEKAGLSSSTPHDPHITKVLNKPVPSGPATQMQNSSILSMSVRFTLILKVDYISQQNLNQIYYQWCS